MNCNVSIKKIMPIIDKINLIDIRSVEKYNNNHIKNAKNIAMDALIVNPSIYLSKNEKYYIYCQKGISSKKICSILRKFGYEVYSIEGGYEAWVLKD